MAGYVLIMRRQRIIIRKRGVFEFADGKIVQVYSTFAKNELDNVPSAGDPNITHRRRIATRTFADSDRERLQASPKMSQLKAASSQDCASSHMGVGSK
jgi:hypothetical protein